MAFPDMKEQGAREQEREKASEAGRQRRVGGWRGGGVGGCVGEGGSWPGQRLGLCVSGEARRAQATD